MPRILLEGDNVATFTPDRAAITKALTEAQAAGRSPYPLSIPGKFSFSDAVNGNGRRYPKRVWEKNLTPGSPLMTSVQERNSLGLLEHPKDGKVDLLSPISHLVTKVCMEGGEVSGEITIVGTAEGMKLRALVEAGYPLKVSSRGFGSVVKAADGVDDVQDDFVCESWDVVANPSFKQAVLQPQPESTALPVSKLWAQLSAQERLAAINADVSAGRIRAESVRLENGVVILEGAKSPALTETTTSPATATITVIPTGTFRAEDLGRPLSPEITTPMDIKQIRESVNSLRSTDVSKLDPRALAEGFTRMHELHREAATLTQDPKMSWDASRIHDELNTLEKTWTETLNGPASNAAKLQEQQTRTLKVLRETATVGVKLRTQLTETTKTLVKKTALLAEVARRGNDWRTRAQKAESKQRAETAKLELAYESLDVFTKRYHEDTTKLARHALMLEHKGKIEADAALLKRVNEATRLEELTAIKEELVKPAAPAPAAPAAPAPAAPVVENTPAAPAPAAPAAPAAAAPAAPAAPAPANVRVEHTVRPFSVSESVAMTTRLSQASAAVLNG